METRSYIPTNPPSLEELWQECLTGDEDNRAFECPVFYPPHIVSNTPHEICVDSTDDNTRPIDPTAQSAVQRREYLESKDDETADEYYELGQLRELNKETLGAMLAYERADDMGHPQAYLAARRMRQQGEFGAEPSFHQQFYGDWPVD